MREIIIGIVTGIISGIISSVIVTQGYRIKDRERDRIQYIEKFRQFYTQLNVFMYRSLAEVDFDEFSKIKAPKKYKWVHITVEDKKIVDEVNALQKKVRDILLDVELESENISDELEKIKLIENYVPQFERLRGEVSELRDDVYLLEYPEHKEAMKRVNAALKENN